MNNNDNLFVNTKHSTYFTGIGMFNKKKKRKNQPKERNWLAVHAHFRKAGSHQDKKREANRKACRGRVKTDI